MRFFTALSLVLLFASCNPEVEAQQDKQANAPKDATAERDSWQRPQEVFMLMGNDLRGKTIADLAANDGYWTFKMISMGANVIAIDVDPVKLAAIDARKKEMGLGDDRLRTRVGTLMGPGLAKDEVDACFLAHSYVRIPDKRTYFTDVFQGTRLPRALFILEWLNSATPIGPPMTDRISSERLMDEISVVGYTDIGAYSAKIPYQAFIFASEQPQTDFPEDYPEQDVMNVPMN